MATASPSPNSDVTNVDGSVDFSGGVNSLKVTTIQSDQNPNGLARNELAWLINGSVRDGGITPRGGWSPIKQVGNGSFAYQGGSLYQPIDGSDPYLVLVIGGRVLKVTIDPATGVIDLMSTAYVFGNNDRPTTTIKNTFLVAGDTIPVNSELQAYFGLPPSFVAPALGANITFQNDGSEPASIGDSILFFGTLQVQSSSVVFDNASTSWKLTAVLKNIDYPPGKTITGSPFGDPHGVPVNGKSTGWSIGWFPSAFVVPAIGATVTVTFTYPLAKIGAGQIAFFQDAAHVGVLNLPATFGIGGFPNEQITLDSVHNQFVDNMHASTDTSITGVLCGRSLSGGSGSFPQQQAKHLDCSLVPDWVFDAFTVGPGLYPIVARRPAIVPPLVPNSGPGADNGLLLHFQFGVAAVVNINRLSVYQFGTDQCFFKQGNEFLVIQAGDYTTLPLFWDGNILRQSGGITNNAVAPGTPGVNELPPGGPMDFYMGRFWYAQGTTFSAGDITGGPSGTAQYSFRDAILNVTENPLVLGGDGFSTPANEGSITALNHNANQDQALGQGVLFAFTPKGAHGLTVPVTRSDWIVASGQNQPKLVPVQLAMGTNSERSVVPVNGDLFYQDPLGNIRTMLTAVRYFGQWGNLPISANINRLTQFTDKTLLRFGCGIYFNNRMIQTALPILTPQGAIHQAVSALDMEPISSFGSQSAPIWEGMYEGLDILQMFSGIFSGEERAFAVVVSRLDFTLQLWELTADERFDNTDTRIQMTAEFPAFTWGNEFSLKQQVGAELWIDRLYGEVVFLLEYRPDGETCWQKWHEWKVCSPRNSCENTGTDPCTGLQQVLCYPLTQFGENYRQTMTLPTPPNKCQSSSGRPAFVNYQCQPRLTVTGFCRVRGFLLHAEPKERQLYTSPVC